MPRIVSQFAGRSSRQCHANALSRMDGLADLHMPTTIDGLSSKRRRTWHHASELPLSIPLKRKATQPQGDASLSSYAATSLPMHVAQTSSSRCASFVHAFAHVMRVTSSAQRPPTSIERTQIRLVKQCFVFLRTIHGHERIHTWVIYATKSGLVRSNMCEHGWGPP